MTVVYQRGIYLPEIDLWLDSQVPRPVAVVSHAHSDHLQSHAVTLATPATVALMRHRLGREGRGVEQRALQVGDLHELVEPGQRGRPCTRGDVVDADGFGGIGLERGLFRCGEPQDGVVDDVPEDCTA